jgi:phosphatidate cytidylyltransferase
MIKNINLHPNIQMCLLSIVGVLVVSSLLLFVFKKKYPQKNLTEISLRTKTWWVIFGVIASALVLSREVAIVLFAIISFISLREFFSLVPVRRADRRVLFWAYLAIPFQYFWIWDSWYGLFIIFIPVFWFLFLPMRMVLVGQTEGFLKSVGTIHWGLMITVFCISHIAFLLALPEEYNPNGGGIGLVLFLVCISQLNDVAQFCFGKMFGRNKVVPTVSPGKTYEGLLGGIFTTLVLAYFVGPRLTPMSEFHSLLSGLFISVGGFVGDIIMSAIKRDVGVKDSGTFLPGHGGILDRVDSISFVAPLFFHYIFYLYYPKL